MMIVLNTMALKWKSELDLESNHSYCDNDQKSNDINLNLTLGCFFRPGHVLEPIKSNISPCRISLLWSVSLVSLHSFSSSCIENKEGDVESMLSFGNTRNCQNLLEAQGTDNFCQCGFLPQQETCQNDNSPGWSSHSKVLFFQYHDDISWYIYDTKAHYVPKEQCIHSKFNSIRGITANTPFTSVLISWCIFDSVPHHHYQHL